MHLRGKSTWGGSGERQIIELSVATTAESGIRGCQYDLLHTGGVCRLDLPFISRRIARSVKTWAEAIATSVLAIEQVSTEQESPTAAPAHTHASTVRTSAHAIATTPGRTHVTSTLV